MFRKANVLAILGSITNNKKTLSYDFSLKGSFLKYADTEKFFMNEIENNYDISANTWDHFLSETSPTISKNGFASSINIS